jgi:uncharacterized protein (TIGR03790 family)
MRKSSKMALAACLLSTQLCASMSNAEPLQVVPLTSNSQNVLVPSTLGIIVNLNDPDSIALGEYYSTVRKIPRRNIIGLHLPRSNFIARHLMRRELEILNRTANLSDFVAFALAFSRPYRLEENQSITSVFAQGIAQQNWHSNCNETSNNPDSGAPAGASLRAKPTMLLDGGDGLQSSIDLVRRGKAADSSSTSGKIWLVQTGDRSRSAPREASMARAAEAFPDNVVLEKLNDKRFAANGQLMGFQTGMSTLPGIKALQFLPGAFADSLTSFGGALNDSRGQTTVSDIIRAGATASYGTVREPCNFASKFPDPARMITNYYSGDSLLEAYWKSVGKPTEGLFVGEPLARPFPPLDASLIENVLTLKANIRTINYIKGVLSRSGQQPKFTDTSHNMVFNIELYSVATGTPHFLKLLRVPASIEPGDVISTIRSDEVSEADIFGILVLGIDN